MLKTKRLLSLAIAIIMIFSTVLCAAAYNGKSGSGKGNAATTAANNGNVGNGQGNAAATAAANNGNAGNGQGNAATAGANANKNSAEYKAAKAKFDEYKAQFKANKAQIQSLRQQISTCAIQIKAQLQNANPDKITAQQMLTYKEAIQEMKDARDIINSEHKGQIQGQIQNMKQARQNQNYGKAVLAFEKILKEQEARIAILQGILKDLQTVTVNQ